MRYRVVTVAERDADLVMRARARADLGFGGPTADQWAALHRIHDAYLRAAPTEFEGPDDPGAAEASRGGLPEDDFA